MRTILDPDANIMDPARKGAITPAPTELKNGFRTFLVPPGTPTFGLDEVRAAEDAEDHEMSRFFARPDSGK